MAKRFRRSLYSSRFDAIARWGILSVVATASAACAGLLGSSDNPDGDTLAADASPPDAEPEAGPPEAGPPPPPRHDASVGDAAARDAATDGPVVDAGDGGGVGDASPVAPVGDASLPGDGGAKGARTGDGGIAPRPLTTDGGPPPPPSAEATRDAGGNKVADAGHPASSVDATVSHGGGDGPSHGHGASTDATFYGSADGDVLEPDGAIRVHDAGPCADACEVGTFSCQSATVVAVCTPQPVGCNTFVTAQLCSDAGLLCERAGSASCADPAWAEWPIPVAADELDAIRGDASVFAGDAEAGTVPSYAVDPDAGVVTDNITGLMWQQGFSPSISADGGIMTLDEAGVGLYVQGQAAGYCSTLALGGFKDWRLPSLIELFSIVDYGARAPAINRDAFPNLPSAGASFWSSTLYAPYPGLAWYVNFDDGTSGARLVNENSSRFFVRCVR